MKHKLDIKMTTDGKVQVTIQHENVVHQTPYVMFFTPEEYAAFTGEFMKFNLSIMLGDKVE